MQDGWRPLIVTIERQSSRIPRWWRQWSSDVAMVEVDEFHIIAQGKTLGDSSNIGILGILILSS